MGGATHIHLTLFFVDEALSQLLHHPWTQKTLTVNGALGAAADGMPRLPQAIVRWISATKTHFSSRFIGCTANVNVNYLLTLTK